MIGEQVAEWLTRRVDPSRIYDHMILHELAAIGISYNDQSHLMWLLTGEIVEVTVYTPAELMKHPHVTFRFSEAGFSRLIPGFEIAYWLHMLLWPTETPPGIVPAMTWGQAFLLNTASIAERGLLPYRQGGL